MTERQQNNAMDEYTESNRVYWNARAAVNAARYDVAGFKAGKSMLTPLVREELGDVSGKSLLHLQCHFGLDTLSWARLGARVTGVDFSEDAIALAQSLSQETGLDARFFCTDIYQLPQALDDTFDQRFPFMEQGENGRWRWKNPTNHIPLTFSLRARKE
jgi:2-polyprenyl-3-methyl-5-hydroxy-6-metoxy-1,4-benzoquinol methylase